MTVAIKTPCEILKIKTQQMHILAKALKKDLPSKSMSLTVSKMINIRLTREKIEFKSFISV